MLHRNITEAIIRTFYRLYDDLGYGFLESVYESGMAIALRKDGLRVDRQRSIPVIYEGVVLGEFRADLIVESAVVCEVKAARAVDGAHEAQLLNYLRACDLEVGLLLNFGSAPTFQRMLFTNDRKNGIPRSPRQGRLQSSSSPPP